jgi:hypothetical protein
MFAFCVLLAAAADPPAMKELFAKEGWYKEQAGKEASFTGKLLYKPLPEGIGIIGRHNAFSLEVEEKGKKVVYEVYSGGKDDLLKPYANKVITLTGKRVDIEVVGRNHREIWPARLKLAPAKKEEPPSR